MPGPDRRIRRTKAALRQALIALITERDYQSIGVQMIVDRADVGRSTFYAHYADKDELLAESLSALGALARQPDRADVPGPAALAFAMPLFQHVDEVRPMFAAMLGRRGPPVVQAAFLETVREILREHVAREDAVHFIAAGFLALARWWVLEAPDHTAEELHARFVALAAPCLAR